MEQLEIDFNQEEWRDIVGYEGLYQVSNLGRVRSLDRVDNRGRLREGKIMAFGRTTKGYLHSLLSKDGCIKGYAIHRLVAQAFLPNPNNLPCVNHKDENPSNNKVENLEWCTYKYNANYGTAIQRSTEKKYKPVQQYTIDGEFVREWKSATEVERYLNINRLEISYCCCQKRKTVKGYQWCFKGDEWRIGKYINSRLKPILQYDLDGNFIKEWESGMDIERQLGFCRSSIFYCCWGRLKQSHGYQWCFRGDETQIGKYVNPRFKPVLQYTLDGEFVREWESISEIKKQLDYNDSCISCCCKGKQKKAYGYIWKYKE